MRIYSGADSSSTPRGWRSPTATQPVFASFYNTAFAGANLANSAAAAQIVGAPVLTTGTVGSALPYLTTQGGSNYLATGLPETPAGTILAIARMRTPTTGAVTDGVIVGNYNFAQTGNTMMIFTADSAPAGAIRGRIPKSTPAGFNVSPPVIADMKNWGLYALRWNCSQTGGASTATLQSVTQGSSGTQTGTGVATGIGTVPLYIGTNVMSSATSQHGLVDHAHTSIFDYALTDDELADTARLLGNYTARYGVTI